MLIANLFVVVVVGGCAAYQYLKGTFVKAFAMLVSMLLATIVAFGYFEVLANVFISRSENSRFGSIVSWAQPLCLVLLFVLAFGIFQTIVIQLTRKRVDLGFAAECGGRVVCGIFCGLTLSSLVLTSLAMGPLPYKYPYPRFEQRNPDVKKPSKTFLSSDSFAAGLFNMVSAGCFSGERSFATVHANFLNQAFLNRNTGSNLISITTTSAAIELYEIERKTAAWPAPEGLRSSDEQNELIEPRNGHHLAVVRVGIMRKAIRDAGIFTFSQLRIVCKQRSSIDKPLAGKGRAVYPFGYLRAEGQLKRIKGLSESVSLQRDDFKGSIKWIDFVFEVPDGYLPVLVEFKQNNIAQVVQFVSSEQAPDAIYFSQKSKK